jgi:DNA polymerase (family 10)
MNQNVTSEDLVELFEWIARLLDLKGENPFKIRAYTNAARAFQQYRGDLQADVETGKIKEMDGIGKAVAEKITEFVTTGQLAYFEKLKGEFPDSIFGLFELQGLGARKIKSLYEELGVSSIDDLEEAIDNGQIAGLAGFGQKTQENLRKAITNSRKHAGRHKLGQVVPYARQLLTYLRQHPEVLQLAEAGSYRRRKNTVHDVDIVLSTNEPQAVGEYFLAHPLITGVEARGETKISVILGKTHVQCDLRMVRDHQFPFALVYFTGSKEHNVALRGRARKRGWTLNEYGFKIIEGQERKAQPIPEVHTEAELYRALELDEIPPELREDDGEIQAAETGDLPQLVKLEMLRGTFHNHTVASDGRHTLEEMAGAAQELGLQYLGIADHSKGQVQANGLDEERLLQQIELMDELNSRLDGIRVIKGVEVDILRDGSLDLSDEVLSRLDYTVASVHSSFTIGEIAMTNRIVRAMQNPYVTMLGHPTGRLLLHREPYAVNLREVIEAAAETRTIIEINANPNRLDMDWRWWPLAKEKGVKCAINPDAHSIQGLDALWFGINVARKGWLTRDDIINCLPLDEVWNELKRKRRAHGLGD